MLVYFTIHINFIRLECQWHVIQWELFKFTKKDFLCFYFENASRHNFQKSKGTNIFLLLQFDLFYTFLRTINKLSMRRRSGAIHSETQQEFILLAQKSLNKTGIFYDQKFYSEVEKIQNQPSTNDEWEKKKNPFAQFDFDEVKQFEKDEKDFNVQMEKQVQVNIKNAIICDQVLTAVKLLGRQSNQLNAERKVDLIVKKLKGQNDQIIIMKYWVIDKEAIESPLSKIYVESAKRIFWASQSPCPLENSKLCRFDELQSEIELYEQQIISRSQ